MVSKKYSGSQKAIYNSCKKALDKLGYKIISDNVRQGTIKAKKKSSFFSFGNNISINVSPKNDNEIELLIKSESIGIQIIDWGTNSEIENDLIQLVSSYLI